MRTEHDLIAIVTGDTIGLTDGDEIRRLREVDTSGARNIHSYRQMVGNPCTNGSIHSFRVGRALLLERASSPLSDPADPDSQDWLVIVDTAIGGPLDRWERMSRRGLVALIPHTTAERKYRSGGESDGCCY